MKQQCISAIQKMARTLGQPSVTADQIQGIERRVFEARKQLALKDINAYRNMTVTQQLEGALKLAMDETLHAANKKKQRAYLTVTKRIERDSVIGNMMAKGMNRFEALRNYLFFKADGKGGVISLESTAKAHEAMALSKILTLKELEDQGFFSGIVTNKKNMEDYIKESFGVDSGNALAKKAWKDVEKVRNELIDKFNSLGGDISKLANYRNPQALDQYRAVVVGDVRDSNGVPTFVNDHLQWVDRSMYVNPDGTLMNDVQLTKFLTEAHKTIMTDGANKPPGEGGGASMIANRQRAHRQIHYKSPEAYLAAMNKYGAGNPFDQTRSSIQALSMDIALVDHMGPNAIHEFELEFAKAAQETGRVDTGLRDAFERISGQRSVSNPRVAKFFQDIRNTMVAAKLGSMLISQVTDLATAKATARAMNIPSSQLMLWLGRVTKDSAAREMLRTHGHGLEVVTNAIARFADDTSPGGFMGKAATVVTSIQGAHVWTRAIRQAFAASMEAHIGGMVSKYASFADLPARDQAILATKGVTDVDWQIWRSAKLDDYNGSKLLSSRAISDINSDSAVKYQAMLVEETHMAVLQPSELQSLNIKKGDIQSELAGMLLQFKSFPWAIFRQHFMDRANFSAAGYSPVVYRAKLLAMTTVLGGFALLMNDLANGKDPQKIVGEDGMDETTAQFFMRAMLKGGGLGIFGDLIEVFKGTAESPTRTAAQLLGPGIGFVAGNVMPSIVAGGRAAITQDEKDIQSFTKYSYDTIKNVLPGQNLWFAKALIHNILLHDLHEMADPGYADRARRNAEKNYGNEYYVGMGEDTRAPNLGNAIGMEQ